MREEGYGGAVNSKTFYWLQKVLDDKYSVNKTKKNFSTQKENKHVYFNMMLVSKSNLILLV